MVLVCPDDNDLVNFAASMVVSARDRNRNHKGITSRLSNRHRMLSARCAYYSNYVTFMWRYNFLCHKLSKYIF